MSIDIFVSRRQTTTIGIESLSCAELRYRLEVINAILIAYACKDAPNVDSCIQREVEEDLKQERWVNPDILGKDQVIQLAKTVLQMRYLEKVDVEELSREAEELADIYIEKCVS